MKKVVVILPAYNGEKYIGAQIESLLNQTWENLDIVVRDDGSRDDTLRVIRSWIGREPKGKRILPVVDDDGNRGYIRNVFDTWKKSEPADYYCFCDQDDVWRPEKIEKCVALLESKGDNVPALCFHGYNVCDSELHFLRKSDPVSAEPDLAAVCYDFPCLNFTIVVNHAFREAFFANLPKDGDYPNYPDSWMAKMAACYGRLYAINEPLAEYRRNDQAASWSNHSAISLLVWRMKKFLAGDEPEKIAKELRDLREVFAPVMIEQDQEMMKVFTEKSRAHYFRRLFWPDRLRRRKIEELELRFLFLLNKFW
ncbi:MAG: glycosyltransferase [Clostridia bacterium]|nr:glycosyltransferase [Clostridia bacterium]